MTVTDATTAEDAAENAAGESAADVPRPASFYDVPGWFYNTDLVLFDWLLSHQERREQAGDLLEMGAYMGKSAIFTARYLRAGEKFTICDLFDSDAPDERNSAEMQHSYSTLTRRSFEANFLSFHDELPRIVQAPTSVVPEEVESGSCRFIHIDASHLYEHVHGDIAAAREALGPDGVVVLDDFRSDHTPGVACATWQAVIEGGLRPICVSSNKFYGTWSDPTALRKELRTALRERGDCWLQTQEVAGQQLLLVGGRKAKPPELPVSRHAAQKAPGTPATPAAAASTKAAPKRPGRTPLRRLAIDLLPPIVTRAIVRVRRRR